MKKFLLGVVSTVGVGAVAAFSQRRGKRRASAGQAADARRFWIIKHGIKGSGMPVWAKGGMDDAAIWDLTAFIKTLPQLSASEYQTLVAASDGHSHAGMAPAAEAPAPAAVHDHGHHKHSHR